MDDTERYLFDLNGYLLVKGMLSRQEVVAFDAASDQLESYVAEHIDDGPRMTGFAGIQYRFDERYGYHSYKNTAGGGLQYIVDDFLNASPGFDLLVNHAKSMDYVKEMIAGPARIGSSELRYRYRSNQTDTHMGGRMDLRNRYEFSGQTQYDSDAMEWRKRDFDLMAVRFLYAIHDVPLENGPLCVVPGSHKSNYFSPFSDLEPTCEPGMVPLPMEAGDAIIFTENTRHGGFPNLLDRPRKTLHMMIGPMWAGSQSPIHWNESVHVSKEAWARYNEAQRALLPRPKDEVESENRLLKGQVSHLKGEIAALEREVTNLKSAIARAAAQQSLLPALKRAIRGR
jgi:hypothetical protein